MRREEGEQQHNITVLFIEFRTRSSRRAMLKSRIQLSETAALSMFSFSRGYGTPQATQVGNNAAATGANTSRNTASQLLRKQQITMLFKENETVRETKSGVYQIGLMLADKKTIITLRIALGDGFPVSAPVLQIMTHATHPWLSNDGYCRVVGHRSCQLEPTLQLRQNRQGDRTRILRASTNFGKNTP